MYKDDIRELRKQKREANLSILLDFARIYLSLRIGFPNLVEERDKLVELVQMYFDADKRENEVLTCIRKHYGTVDEHEEVDNLLDEFDNMFDRLWEHIQTTFLDYEEVMEEYGNFLDWFFHWMECIATQKPYEPASDVRYRMKHYPIRFPTFDEAYKQKMLEYIPNLPESKEVEF